jgi:hypothetical protein
VPPARIRRRAVICSAGGAALGLVVPRPLLGAELTHDEQWRLAGFSPIRVPLDLDFPQGSYFGGLAYQRIDATVDEVMTLGSDPASYTSILYATHEARVLSRRGRDVQVYLRQGEGLASVSYVVLVRRESENLIRFWLDLSQPHDLDDGWGFLRAEPWPKQLGGLVVTWGVLMRIDAAPLKLQFSESLRRYAMETPSLLVQTLIARRKGQRPARST